ncbi:MAG: hypothetical protein WD824_06085 [Cyclobacteriaceae bacterium]
MKISYLIFLGFLLILIMFSITTYINYRQTEKVNENSEWSAKSTTVMRESNRFQRNMAEVLSENIRLLQRKNEELDQFAHIVSHDLKAPLRGIDNVITWIEEDHSTELPPKISEYIQRHRVPDQYQANRRMEGNKGFHHHNLGRTGG